MVTIRLSKNFVYDVVAHFSVHDVVALNIYYFTMMEGGGVLTPVIGYLIDRFGFTAAFATAGGSLLTITLLCSLWLWEKRN